ncbi:MAG: aminotransferase class I/II-fold pyridoxal phosphate-dependent enzyme [Methylocystaceae bacterium]
MMISPISIDQYEEQLEVIYRQINRIAQGNQLRVLNAFREHGLSESHFRNYTGYGYGDAGRDIMEKIWARIFGAEDALVRSGIVSGTHALTLVMAAHLRSGDELCSLTGTPYDTMQQVIGTRGNSPQSLLNRGISYRELPLLADGTVDKDSIASAIGKQTKMVLLQRSRGYSLRKSLGCAEIKELVTAVRQIKPEVIVLVDNCYGEFVEEQEPCSVGANLVAGSLIKNPGGGIIPGGGYIAGDRSLVEQVAEWLTAPGLGKEVGPTLVDQRLMFQGLFMAPSVVANALKGAALIAMVMEGLGYQTNPRAEEPRVDIVQAINLGSAEKVLRFCQVVQQMSPVDSQAHLEYGDMPGYDDPIVMAAGTFVQGSSIELSCDAPRREPFTAYWQGGLTYEHVRCVVQALYDLFSE